MKSLFKQNQVVIVVIAKLFLQVASNFNNNILQNNKDPRILDKRKILRL